MFKYYKMALDKHFTFLCALLIATYFFMLIYNINGINLVVGDERANSSGVFLLLKGYVVKNDSPLLVKTIWYYFVFIFSGITGKYSPFIWRSGTIFLSVWCLIVFYKIARFLLLKPLAFFTTVLLAIDPMYFSLSRLMQPEIPFLFFLLLSVFCFFQLLETKKYSWIYWCSLFLGLSLAVSKSAFLLAIFLLLGNSILVKKKRAIFKVNKKWIATHIILISIVALGFFVGNAIFFFKQHQLNVFQFYHTLVFSQKSASGIQKESFLNSAAWSWFLVPQILPLYRMLSQKNFVQTIEVFVNPFITFSFWIDILIAIILVRNKKLKRKKYVCVLLITIFSLYAPLLFQKQITYYYLILPLIPFSVLLLVYIFSQLKVKTYGYLFLFVGSVSVFITSFPLLTGKTISRKYDNLLFSYSKYAFNTVNSLFCNLCYPHDISLSKKNRR